MPLKATYELIVDINNIKAAISSVAKNSGSNTAGVDGMTKADYPDLDALANEVHKRMQKYRPGAVRRVYIPKPGSDKTRPLGIPNYIDRVVQMAIKRVIEPICEDRFYRKSYGFRPGRSAENAIADIHKIVTLSRNYHVASVDIKGFFDNVNHEILMCQVKRMGVTCKRTLALIKAILKAPVSDNGVCKKPNAGTPQGGIISPLLSNIVLNDIDWLVDKQWLGREHRPVNKVTGKLANSVRANNDVKLKKMREEGISSKWIVRYADDFVLLSDTEEGAKELMDLVVRKLTKLGLEVSKEKTRVVDLRNSYIEFLGFKLYTKFNGQARNTRGMVIGSHVLQTKLSDKTAKKAYEKLKQAWQAFEEISSVERYRNLNSVIVGTQNYYRIATDIGNVTGTWEHRLWTPMSKSSVAKLSKVYPTYLRKRYPGHNSGLFWSKYGAIAPICISQKRPMPYKAKEESVFEENVRLLESRVIDEWTYIRAKVYNRDKGICARTGKFVDLDDLDIHHVMPRCFGGKDELSNLVCMSKSAHVEHHREYRYETVIYVRIDGIKPEAVVAQSRLG